MEVWYADISGVGAEVYGRLLDRASARRKAQAERYLYPADKVRCVVADALIRCAVEQILGIREFTVDTDGYGKPYIVGQEGFHFNLSHSGDWVVLAHSDRPVGVDVQRMEPSADIQKLCRLFTSRERDFIMEAVGQDRLERFYRVWTAKESYLKYLGVGLRRGLDRFSVLPEAGPPGVQSSTVVRGGYCLTLCAEEPTDRVTWIPVTF